MNKRKSELQNPLDTKEYKYARKMKDHCRERMADILGIVDCYIGRILNKDETQWTTAIYFVVRDEATEVVVRKRLSRIKSIPIRIIRNDLMEKATRVKEAHSNAFFAVEGVNGHGIGLTKEDLNPKPCICIYTETQEAQERAQKIFGTSIEGVPLKYTVVGKITAL